MSYRNDHDAALARVDALTHELDRTEAERDHLQAELEELRTGPPRAPVKTRKVGGRVLALTLGVCIAAVARLLAPLAEAPRTPPAAPVAEAPPARSTPSPKPVAPAPSASASARVDDATRRTQVVACVDRLQAAIAQTGPRTDLRSLRAGCRPEIAMLISHRAVPGPVSDLLVRWSALEDRLSPSLAAYNTYVLRDPQGKHYRAPAALRDAFDAALEARNAILPELHTALHELVAPAASAPLAHALVEAPRRP